MIKTINELLQETETEKEDIKVENAVSGEEANTSVSNTDVVIELLKKSLNIHWQQTASLSAQAVHLDRWGYKKLSAIIKADAEQEHKHAMENIKRLEFFDIDYQPLIISAPSWTRHDMIAIIQYNLNSVKEAAETERAVILAARAVGDELTANSTIPLLQGSEDGIILYESFLKTIEQMGLDNFLSIQV